MISAGQQTTAFLRSSLDYFVACELGFERPDGTAFRAQQHQHRLPET